MTGDDVRTIREHLADLLGRHISHRDLGLALGLAPANAKDSARRWEDEAPTGPAALALELLIHCAENGGLEKVRDIFARDDAAIAR